MSFKQLQVFCHSKDYQKAVKVVNVPLTEPASDQIRVRQLYAGLNFGDGIIASGTMFPRDTFPFNLGIEAIGTIDAIGSSIPKEKYPIGQPVLVVDWNNFSGYSEYSLHTTKTVYRIPELNPKYLVCGVNALTAVVSLDTYAPALKGKKILITGASGGTGHIAVQWAKQKGAYVIGLASNEDKVKYLQQLQVDRVINYRTENLDQTLKDHFPDGVDIVWEVVGGQTYQTLFNNLAVNGRMIVVGRIEENLSTGQPADLNLHLIIKSQSICGFKLDNLEHLIPEYYDKIIAAVQDGSIKPKVDTGIRTPGGIFVGLDQVHRAIDWLMSGKNMGKVVVKIQN